MKRGKERDLKQKKATICPDVEPMKEWMRKDIKILKLFIV